MNTKGLFMAVHVIQSYPSNNLNRGEDGSPKSCIFGGVRRSRVSSQCIKRNARLAMYDVISENDENGMGIRTKTMPTIIAALLGNWAESAENVAWTDDEAEKQKYHEAAKEFDIRDVSHALTAVGMQIDAKKNHTLKSVYCTNMKQCVAFAKAMLEIGSKRAGEDKDGNLKLNPYDTKTELPALDDALDSSISLDIMMFGRMQAGRPIHNVEACIQVGHEFSTHRAEEEFDYFTAVDDAKSMLKEQGSAHLDTQEFTSATMYRYSSMDLRAMYQTMKKNGSDMNLAMLAKEWVRAFALAAPTGKQNSFAATTLPVYVFVEFRNDAPVSFANAFEKAVEDGTDGYEGASIKAFEERVRRADAIGWLHAPVARFLVSEQASSLQDCTQPNFNALLDHVEETVKNAVSGMEKERS